MFQIDEWRNQSWRLHSIERHRTRCEVGVATDGSRSNRCEQESFKNYFVPSGDVSMHTIYLRSQNVGYAIEDTARVVHGGSCGCTSKVPRVVSDDDAACRRNAEVRLPRGQRVGDGQIAGHAVVRYRADTEDGAVTELSLAPALGCEAMEEVRTWPGTLGIPGARWRYRVTDYKPGEPAPSLFQMPGGCAVRRRTM